MADDDRHAQRDAGLKPKKLRLWRGADLRESALLALFRIVIATTPASEWAGFAEGATRFGKGRRSSRFKRFAGRVKAVQAGADDEAVLRMWRAYRAAVNRRRISILASRYCPGWKPRIELTGREHLDRAIAATKAAAKTKAKTTTKDGTIDARRAVRNRAEVIAPRGSFKSLECLVWTRWRASWIKETSRRRSAVARTKK